MTLGHKYDSITGFSMQQVEETCEHPEFKRWIFRGSDKRRRMRIVLSMVIHHEMDEGRWYTTDELRALCLTHDARGGSSMMMSNVRIGTLMRVMISREVVEFRKGLGSREYKKVKENDNMEMPRMQE